METAQEQKPLQEVMVLGTNERLIREIGEQNKNLIIADSKSYDATKKARTALVTLRTSIDRARKQANEGHKAKIDGNNTDAAALKAIVSEYEEPLQTEVKRWEAKLGEEKAAKELEENQRTQGLRDMVDAIRNIGNSVYGKTTGEINAATDRLIKIDITDEAYQEYAIEASQVLKQALATTGDEYQKAVEREAEDKRLQAAAVELKAKEDRLAEEQATMDAKNKERDDELAERQRNIDAEEQRQKDAREAIERDKQAAADEEQRKENERKAELQREQDEKDRLAREEALRPDKEKLMAFADIIDVIRGPVVTSEEANEVVLAATTKLAEISYNLREQCAAL